MFPIFVAPDKKPNPKEFLLVSAILIAVPIVLYFIIGDARILWIAGIMAVSLGISFILMLIALVIRK